MKNCPECGKELPDEVAYCIFCGTDASRSKLYKTTRRVFFITPFFLLLITLGLSYDLSVEAFVETSLTAAGALSCVYFAGAALLGIFRFFFKIYVIPGSFLTAGITALINGLTTLVAVEVIEKYYLLEKIDRLGPSANLKNHLMLLAMIIIPLQILETLAISAKAKINTKPDTATGLFQKQFYKKAYVVIPILYIALTSIGVYQLQEPAQYALLTEGLISVSALEKAEKVLNDGLNKFQNDALLCSLKTKLLTESVFFATNLKIPDIKEALNYAEKAATLKPESPTYKHNLSLMLELNRSQEEAIRIASEAASLAPTDTFLWQHLGNLNHKYRHYDDAIYAYNKLLSIDPDNALILNNLAYTLLASKKNPALALSLVQKSVELDSTILASRDTLAWAYYKNGRFPEALEAISFLYKERSEISPEIDFHYTAILNAMGLLNNPIETFDKMIVKPEVALNRDLVLEIIEERQKAEEKSQKLNE